MQLIFVSIVHKMLLRCNDRLQLFNLWTLLYASYTENHENQMHVISVEYDNAGQGIFDILHRILDDPSFETVDEKVMKLFIV